MSRKTKEIIIRPQEGKQEDCLSSPADIVIYGGAAGGGKTWALLLDPLRHINTKDFNGVIFRRETPQIRNPGSLWDEAVKIYSYLSAQLNKSSLEIIFGKSKLKFSHLEYEDDKYDWHGAQICYLGFDELTQFLETQFWYLVGRNRSVCGIRPYVRATCNPDCDSWVKKLIDWWLDDNNEYPDPKKSGKIRWFIRLNDEMIWGDSKNELKERYPEEIPKSITFIPSNIYDNKILLKKDPGYLANLKAQNKVDRERLEKGNWKIKPIAGMFFKKEWFEIVDLPPKDVIGKVRYWDRAATVPSKKNKDPDWTCGLRMSRDKEGYYYIEHIARFRESAFKMRTNIKNIAKLDSENVIVGLEQEPGASGVIEVRDMIRILSGFICKAYPAIKDKITRAMPFSSQCEARNVKLVKGSWNDAYLTELENFCGDGKSHDDQVDISSGAFEMLQEKDNKLQMWEYVETDKSDRPIDTIRKRKLERFAENK